MQNDDPNAIAASLRVQSFENPKAARAQLEALLNGEESILKSVLDIVSKPGNGRLRQMIANAACPDDVRASLRQYFTEWLTHETDEFARQSIEYSLRADHTEVPKTALRPGIADPILVEMYRYASSRISHELRNSLLSPKKRLLQMHAAVRNVEDHESRSHLEQLVKQLEQDLIRTGRVCEFESGDQFFAMQPYVLADWMEAMNADYAKRFQPIGLRLDGDTASKAARVVASSHHLRTIFWNLWMNSHQAIGENCRIVAEFSIKNEQLLVIVSDNGDGLPENLDGFAFSDSVSTRSPNRGRGLLEVQYSINELHGNALLARQTDGDLRVALTFPLEVR